MVGANYVEYTDKVQINTDPSWNSPSMGAGDIAICVGATSVGSKALGTPTWGGVAMSLHVQVSGGGGADMAGVGIWYLFDPPRGVSTVTGDFSGTGFYGFGCAIKARGIQQADPKGDSSVGYLNGAGISQIDLADVLVDGLTIGGSCVNTSQSNTGEQSTVTGQAMGGSKTMYVGYTHYGTGIATVRHEWDWAGGFDGAKAAAVFQGGGGRRGMVGVF